MVSSIFEYVKIDFNSVKFVWTCLYVF